MTIGPKITVQESTSSRIVFDLHNADQSFANSLRRVMMAEVPTLAIEIVTIDENNSTLFDEFIAHRAGLLPIDSRKADDLMYTRECSCTSSCRHCSVHYTLNVTASDQGITDVTHYDVVGANPDDPLPTPSWDRRRTVAENSMKAIILAKLRQNQRVSMSLVARKGVGRMHAKYNPTGTVSMVYEPVIEVDRGIEASATREEREKIVQSCPRRVYGLNESERLVVVRKDECILCDECVTKCGEIGKKGLVRVGHDTEKVRFTVESTGVLPPAEIVRRAIKVLQTKWNKLTSDLSAWEKAFPGTSND